jgi:glycosyltransferase involved in cell wall biosynthesis
VDNKIRIIGAAFGNPLSERVFSGVSKYLFTALEKRNVVSGYVSTRQLRPWDLLNYALDFSKTFKYGRPGMNTLWVWKRSTVEKLTARVRRKMEVFDDFNTILQVGTHAIIESNWVKHYCFTDMTIVQVIKSPSGKNFAAGKLPKQQHSEAIEAQRAIFQSCVGIFVNSHWTRNSILNDYGINANKIHVVGAGVSLPVNSLPKKNSESHNILFIGRDWVHKGGPVLVKALSLVRRKFEDATLTVIGCRPRLQDRNVKVLGKLNKNIGSDRQMIENALASAAVLCVPSKFETYGICFLEAQLYGVPPITFTGEGREDAIKDGETGILLEDRTPEALSEAIMDLFSDPDKTRKMGQAGHEYVSNNLTWDCVADRVHGDRCNFFRTNELNLFSILGIVGSSLGHAKQIKLMLQDF